MITEIILFISLLIIGLCIIFYAFIQYKYFINNSKYDVVKVKTKWVDDFEFSICKTFILYDIIVESDDIKCLKRYRKKHGLRSKVFKEGVFFRPLMVIDTFDNIRDAKRFFKNIGD